MLEQKNRSRARVRLAVFFVLSIHVIGLMALLMQGCRRQEVVENQPPVDTSPIPPMPTLDTNAIAPANVTPPPMLPPAPPPMPIVAQNPETYTVAAGDNFTTIARKFPGVTARAIAEANPGVEPTRIHPGEVLHIPPPPPPAPTMTASATLSTQNPTVEGDHLYTVQSGDNLTRIAEKFKTSVRALRAANPNLTTDRIIVGQKLKIPTHATPPPLATPAVTASAQPAA